jgi:hypothetical protein
MATGIVTENMQAKAERLATVLPFLHKGRSKRDGARFFIIPGSKAGTAWWANALGCNCPGFLARGVCAHQEACRIARDRAQAEVVRLAQRCRVDGCGNMRESRTGRCREHFATLVEELGI